MALNIPVPNSAQQLPFGVWQLFLEIVRRSLDVSINPAQMNVGLKVTGNDITIVTPGNGLILSSRDGTKTFRLIMENDGTISADRIT